MSMTVQGYGVNSDNLIWKNAYDILTNGFIENDSFLKALYDEFKAAEGDYYGDGEEDLFDAFCDQYENTMYGWWGFQGVVNDYANEQLFGDQDVLSYDDYCFYVDSRDALELGITTEEIKSKLKDFFALFGNDDVKVDWYDIHLG